MDLLKPIDSDNWQTNFVEQQSQEAVDVLESGFIIYFPKLAFSLSDAEKQFLSKDSLGPKSKNISYDIRVDKLRGNAYQGDEHHALQTILKRYAIQTKNLLSNLLPDYLAGLQQARTSFRPIEVKGRKTSFRKDDIRLHVDAFPSTPTKGVRILRVFSNIDYITHKLRIWRVKHEFSKLVERFKPRLKKPFPSSASIMQRLKLTKDYRTCYDHYMLQLHDSMKKDLDYQKKNQQQHLELPVATTWMVYTDLVPHAAMSGQHMLEQTFHLPVSAMVNPNRSPLRQLENHFNYEALV